MNSLNPLIVQSDSTLLLEVNNQLFRETRDAVSIFAHLEKSPEHIHTYVITPLSLWNAASLGKTAEEVINCLDRYSKYAVPSNIADTIREIMGRFGKLILIKEGDTLYLTSNDHDFLFNLSQQPKIKSLLGVMSEKNRFKITPAHRGLLKQAFISLGYPVHDQAGYVDGAPFPVVLRSETSEGVAFQVREYQRHAVEGFLGTLSMPGGSGVVVLPCGAGKTIVGIAAMAALQRKTLILVTNITAAHQWRNEILNKTYIENSDIGEYSGESKEIKNVTIATYQILTHRKRKTDPFIHYSLFDRENWGLIIYDEVHLLPAPVFKFTADLQARRRLGLTATLIREDGHEKDVFALIGPKKFDVPWKVLEKQGWIATATCTEIRIDLPATEKMRYLTLPANEQIRLSYENPNKIAVAKELVARHRSERILIIGQYLTQIHLFGSEFDAPIITGATGNSRRDELFQKFRKGEIKLLILSKVGNFAIDLPDASVAIQISGSFGSRQEEAQRLGRILRPKANNEQARFYSLVSRETKEVDFAMKRQRFLAEQGYPYEIEYRSFEP